MCIVDELQLFRAVVPHNDAWMSARTADEKAKIKALRQEASSLKALFTSWPFLVKLGTLAVGWVIFFGEPMLCNRIFFAPSFCCCLDIRWSDQHDELTACVAARSQRCSSK
jgi:hypothetical protein